MNLPALFHTTQWSMVLSAAEDSSAALEKLCRGYWRPLYGYARCAGCGEHDAEDKVQGFHGKVIERQWLRTVTRETGPFRRFLQMAFKNYMLDEYDRSQAQKRGGRTATLELDALGAEVFCARELATTERPDKACARAWALEVFTKARRTLREECLGPGARRRTTRWNSASLMPRWRRASACR